MISPKGMEKLMIVHHFLCMVIWPISYHYRAGCHYLLCFTASELSTPLVWLVAYFLPLFGVTGTARTALGGLLVLVFFLVRVLPAPALWWSLVSSQSYWADVPRAIYVTAMLTLPIPSMLFIYWWWHRLFLKLVEALTGSADKKD